MTGASDRPPTIFALSSGRPPAAIAVIRISGPGAHAAAVRLSGDLPNVRHAAVRTLRDPVTGDHLDAALVLRFDAPNSATGEDVVELHCHGGRAVTEAVTDALRALDGLREAEPGEFTRRAFENGRIDLTEAEGLADLLAAETELQRRSALALSEGVLRRTIEDWQERLLALSAKAEAAIDYVDETEDEPAMLFAADIRELRDEIAALLARPRIEPLRYGFRVVIAGPPNAGKSSLLNALIGHDRAIVDAQAGTTRDHIDVPLALDGLPILLTDTAGMRATDDRVEAQGVGRAARLVDSADLLLWLGASAECPAAKTALRVQPKADINDDVDPQADLRLSSRTGEGLDELLRSIATFARQAMPVEGEIAVNARQAAELEGARGALSLDHLDDPILAAEALRLARNHFDRITGRSGTEEFLDALFGRFCLGK